MNNRKKNNTSNRVMLEVVFFLIPVTFLSMILLAFEGDVTGVISFGIMFFLMISSYQEYRERKLARTLRRKQKRLEFYEDFYHFDSENEDEFF